MGGVFWGGPKNNKGKKINLFKNGNPTSRPFMVRLSGMATSLIVSLGLMGIIIFLSKTLPSGSDSSYDPNFAKGLKFGELNGTGVVLTGPAITLTPSAPSPSASPVVLASSSLPPPITAGPGTTSSTAAAPPSSSPTITTSPTSQPPVGIPSDSTDPCVTSTEVCVSDICRATFASIPGCGVSSSSPSSLSPPVSSDPCMTSTQFCVSDICRPTLEPIPGCGVSASASSSPSITSPPVTSDPCLTTTQHCVSDVCRPTVEPIPGCGVSSSAPSSVPSITSDPCMTSTQHCVSDICRPTLEPIPGCRVSSSSPSTTSPPVTPDPCVTSWVDCPTTIFKRNFKRQEDGDGCSWTTSTYASCYPSSTISSSGPSSSGPSDPCTTVSLYCPVGTRDKLGRRQDDECMLITTTVEGCYPSSSTVPSTSVNTTTTAPGSSTSSSVDGCITSQVVCLGKRQEGCFTRTFTAADCAPSSSSSGPSSTTASSTPASISSGPSSVNTCLASAVTCTTHIDATKQRRKKREDVVICETSYYTLDACISTPPPSSSPSSTVSVDSCLVTDVTCSTVDILSRLGKRVVITDCATSYVTASACLPTSTPASSSSTITPTSSGPGSCDPTTVITCPTISPPTRKRQEGEECTTDIVIPSSCISSTSPPPSTSSPPPSSVPPSSTSSIPDICAPTTVITCPTIIPPTRKRQEGEECTTDILVPPSCISSTSPPPSTSSPPPSSIPPSSTSSSPDSCAPTTVITCPTIIPPTRKRQEGEECTTDIVVPPSCSPSSSIPPTSSVPPSSTSPSTTSSPPPSSVPPSSTSSSPDGCAPTTVITCPILPPSRRRQEGEECTTSIAVPPSCISSSLVPSTSSIPPSTTSSPPPSSEPGSCMPTTVITCPTVLPIGRKRQEGEDCTTDVVVPSSCFSSSPIPSTTSAPPSSPPPSTTSSPPSSEPGGCTGTTLITCPTFFPPTRKRQEGEGCVTEIIIPSSCSPSSSLPPSTSSAPPSSTPPSTTSSSPPSSEPGSCASTTIVTCPTFFPPTRKRQEGEGCVTQVVAPSSCSPSSVPPSTSSTPPSSTPPSSVPPSSVPPSSTISEPGSCAASTVIICPSIFPPTRKRQEGEQCVTDVFVPSSCFSSSIPPTSSPVPPSSTSSPPTSSPPSSTPPSSTPPSSTPPTSTPPSSTPPSSTPPSSTPPSSTPPSSSPPSSSPPSSTSPPTSPLTSIPSGSTTGPASVQSSSPSASSVPSSVSSPVVTPVTPQTASETGTPTPPTSAPTTSDSTTPITLPTKVATPTSENSSTQPTSSLLSTIPTSELVTTPSSTSPTTSAASSESSQSSLTSQTSSATTTTASTATPQSAVSESSTSAVILPTSAPDPSHPSSFDHRNVWPTFSQGQAVVGNHAPIVVARGFTMVLGAVYTHLNVYEPIRRLADGGIAGPELVEGGPSAIHLAMFMAHLGSAFSAGATLVDTTYCNVPPTFNQPNPCPPRIAVNQWVLDVILVALIVQVVVLVYAIAKWFKKPGGLSADPTTIAGVAVVMGHPVVEQQFSGFPGDITQAELKERLKHHEFKLGTYMSEGGLTKYGIMPADEADAEGKRKKVRQPNPIAAWFGRVGAKVASVTNRIPLLRSQPTNGNLLFDGGFLLLLLALLGLTIATVVNVDQPQTVFLATSTSAGTGMKIFFAILGIAVSIYWGRLFRDAQTFAPYFPLRGGEARPNPTILLNRHSNPVTAVLPLLRNRHVAAASVALTGLVAELLIIALAGLPYRPGQLRSEFLFSGITAVVILVLMITQLVVINFWRRSLPHLPRRPDTIANVMTYVANTSIVRDFQGLESLSTRRRNQTIRDMRKTYAYGWRREDETGRIRWVVDEVVSPESKNLLDHRSGDRTSDEPPAGDRV